MNSRNTRSLLQAGLCILLCVATALTLRTSGAHSRPSAVQAHAVTPPHLQDPDRPCAQCHAAIYNSYQQTSMARGSGVAAEALHTGTFTHAPSQVTYRIDEKDGIARLRSTRSTEDSANLSPGTAEQHLNDSEQLSYFIGSGKHGRTYLFSRLLTVSPEQTGARLWYEAPVNWYTRRSRYDMAPAFDNAVYAPLALPTDANCLHCHATGIERPLDTAVNAFPDQPFQQAGIGCAACHGNATAHVESQGKQRMLKLTALTPTKRDSICLQCHLEGDAMVQRPGKSLNRFQPGQDLSDTAIYFVNTSSPKSAQRASSQYESLLRSACRRAAGDTLTCTTCHDPHSSPAPGQRVAFYRGKCLQCHGGFPSSQGSSFPQASSSPQGSSAGTAFPKKPDFNMVAGHSAKPFNAATHHPDQPDCAVCHMPSRATSDISHEQNVDHDIEAVPYSRRAGTAPAQTPEPPAALQLHTLGEPPTPPIAPSATQAAATRFTHVVDLAPVGTAQPTDRETGLAYAQFATRGDRGSYTRALAMLRKTEAAGAADAPVHEQLAYLAQIARDLKTARAEYQAALRENPNSAPALSNLAVLEAQAGETSSAIAHLQTVAAHDPGQTAAVLNLSMLQCRTGDAKAARFSLQQALRFNPDSPEAHHYLATGDYAGLHCAIH